MIAVVKHMARTPAAAADGARPPVQARNSQLRAQFPARSAQACWPDTAQTLEQTMRRLACPPFLHQRKATQAARQRGAAKLLRWLASFPGSTWQQRWLGIGEVIAGVLPAGKADAIRRLQDAGRVAMAGDGVNAAALAQADLGLAMGTGTDAAIDAADLTLVRGDLLAVPDAIRLSRRTLRTIKGNLFWAFAYNAAAISLAAAGYLSPLIAAAAVSARSAWTRHPRRRATTTSRCSWTWTAAACCSRPRARAPPRSARSPRT